MSRLLYLLIPAAFLLAACDGTSDRIGNQPDPDPPQATQLRDLVTDEINNNTNDTALPVEINDLEFEIDTTPIDLDTVAG